MNQLEQKIREKVCEANPSILDLVVGCKVRSKNPDDFKWVEKDDNAVVITNYGSLIRVSWLDTRISTEEIEDFEIIGRDITLADVLYVFEKELTDAGVYTKRPYDEIFSQIIGHWDLTKNFNQQSDEVKQFIYEIIK